MYPYPVRAVSICHCRAHAAPRFSAFIMALFAPTFDSHETTVKSSTFTPNAETAVNRSASILLLHSKLTAEPVLKNPRPLPSGHPRPAPRSIA